MKGIVTSKIGSSLPGTSSEKNGRHVDAVNVDDLVERAHEVAVEFVATHSPFFGAFSNQGATTDVAASAALVAAYQHDLCSIAAAEKIAISIDRLTDALVVFSAAVSEGGKP
jgi:hypothetical protein